MTAAASRSVRPFESGAEEKRGSKPVAGDVIPQVDDVARLLASQHAAVLAERLEHVPVADVGRDHADPALAHQPVEAEIRHHGDGDQIDLQVEGEDRQDLVAVDRLAFGIDREHAIAVAVEGDAEVEPPSPTTRVRSDRSVAPQPTLMFSPSGAAATGVTSAPSRSNACGAMPEYAPFAQSTAILSPDRSLPKRSTMCSK